MTFMAGTACSHDWPAQRVAVHYGNSLTDPTLAPGSSEPEKLSLPRRFPRGLPIPKAGLWPTRRKNSQHYVGASPTNL